MSIFEKAYELKNDAPKPTDTELYYREAYEQYQKLLNGTCPEKAYQSYFEQNPAFMPGAYEIIGAASSHLPIRNTLISQPIITNEDKVRKPDFLWLAKDSLNFCPVFIEIERPTKEEFRKHSDESRAQFNQALGQIKQWKAIFEETDSRKDFYHRFGIDERWQRLKFSPQYLLVYGRRSEYEGDSWLTNIRAQEQQNDIRIMSFDRLVEPDRNVVDCITCQVRNGRYHVIGIPPTFVYRPCTISEIGGYEQFVGFLAAIKNMQLTSIERKKFLCERYEYWNKQALTIGSGIIDPFDKE